LVVKFLNNFGNTTHRMEEQALLNVTASIGFNFSKQNCMLVHPSDMHFIWA